jgi:hypothetical protein
MTKQIEITNEKSLKDICLALLISLSASLLSLSALAADIAESAAKKLSGSVTIGRSNSLYNQNNGTEQASLDFATNLSYKIDKNFSIQGLIEASQDLKNDENSDLSRGQISLKSSPTLYRSFNFAGSLAFNIPVSKTQKAASLQAGLAATAHAELDQELMPSPKLSLAFILSGSRSFHQYETTINGRVNTQNSSTQGLEVGWAFTDKTSASVGVNHINTWSYFGTMKEFYNHSEELTHQFSSKFNLALGHSLGSPYLSVYKSNGQDRSFLITDDENSFVYVSATILY